jgi:hypothetical protein
MDLSEQTAHHDRLRRVLRALRPWKRRRRMDMTFPISIYLSDEVAHRNVQAAVEDLLRSEGAEVMLPSVMAPQRGRMFKSFLDL